ncbi:2OG-Fe(II) oxygenase [Edaphobacter bradus]|uniref:2OG-Fe(II) oxygenase n=1 Tax=Edaphobacter bradus TaxID=2259016 RepID=UPI0021E07D0A|nr:2OG-Fe(II) oxygenase [Edaphobacter bradus]
MNNLLQTENESLLREEINFDDLSSDFDSGDPFRHIVIDNFLREDVARAVAEEFPEFDGPAWSVYNNAIEVKKALNHWDRFPKNTYALFNFLNSDEFVAEMSKLAGVKLWADPGLHGGGWHSHAAGGKLNTHLDYSIHPKLGLERILNLIVYVAPDWREEYGGALGLWADNNGAPGELRKQISCMFNRAVIFDTSQRSWHGLPEPVTCPPGRARNSLAVYYLCEPRESAADRGRALFAPHGEQANDPGVLELIKLRSQVNTSQSVYRTNVNGESKN